MDRFIIYGLLDPRTEQIRYIGKSCGGMKRPAQHRQPNFLRRDRTHKGNWIRELLAEGLSYDVRVLESVDSQASLDDAERFWIAQGKGLGWPLTNLSRGGDGGAQPPEVLARIAAKLRGRPTWNKGRKMSREEWKQYGFDRTGRPHTPATKAKFSQQRQKNRNAARLPIDHVQAIRVLIRARADRRFIAKLFGVDLAQISRIATGRAHRGVP